MVGKLLSSSTPPTHKHETDCKLKGYNWSVYKNVILVDFKAGKNWELVKKLNQYAPFDVDGMTSNKSFFHTKLGSVLRYLIYFLYPLYFLLFRSRRYDKIVGYQQFFGINFAFWCRLLHLRKRHYLAISTFIYKSRGGYLGRFYYRYVKWSIDNKYVDKIICFSSTEPQYYAETFNMPLTKFAYIPLGMARIDGVNTVKGDYVFSTGRSNRDYDFLIEALSKTDIKVKIACGGYKYNGKSDIKNVEILQNCYGKNMLEELAHSFCVVIPLKDSHISSGQLVILQAIQLGKPVIVTENDTAKDYVENGKTGYIIKKDKEDLLATIKRLRDNDNLYSDISNKAASVFEERYSLDKDAQNIWNLIK